MVRVLKDRVRLLFKVYWRIFVISIYDIKDTLPSFLYIVESLFKSIILRAHFRILKQIFISLHEYSISDLGKWWPYTLVLLEPFIPQEATFMLCIRQFCKRIIPIYDGAKPTISTAIVRPRAVMGVASKDNILLACVLLIVSGKYFHEC